MDTTNLKNNTTAAAAAAAAAAVIGSDISYIKRDIVDIKDTLKSMISTQDGKIEKLESKLDSLSTIVYTGVGASVAISFLLKFFFKG